MSAECTPQIVCRWSFRSVKSLCMFAITHSMFLSLSSVAFYIAFYLSFSHYAMSATAVMCFTFKAAVRVVSWAASSRIVSVGSWTTWVLSFLLVLLFFVALASPFSWFSLLPFTSARGTRHFLPVSQFVSSMVSGLQSMWLMLPKHYDYLWDFSSWLLLMMPWCLLDLPLPNCHQSYHHGSYKHYAVYNRLPPAAQRTSSSYHSFLEGISTFPLNDQRHSQSQTGFYVIKRSLPCCKCSMIWIRFHHPREKRIGWITKEKQRNIFATNIFRFVGQWGPCCALDINIWISQYMHILSTPWPSNVDIHESILMINKRLHYNRVILFPVSVVQRIIFSCNYFNVCPIYCSCTLWKFPALKESIHNNLQIFSLWHSHIAWSKFLTNALHTWLAMQQTVESLTLNRWLRVLYSTLVPNRHKAIAIHCSTETGQRKNSFLQRSSCNSLTK